MVSRRRDSELEQIGWDYSIALLRINSFALLAHRRAKRFGGKTKVGAADGEGFGLCGAFTGGIDASEVDGE